MVIPVLTTDGIVHTNKMCSEALYPVWWSCTGSPELAMMVLIQQDTSGLLASDCEMHEIRNRVYAGNMTGTSMEDVKSDERRSPFVISRILARALFLVAVNILVDVVEKIVECQQKGIHLKKTQMIKNVNRSFMRNG